MAVWSSIDAWRSPEGQYAQAMLCCLPDSKLVLYTHQLHQLESLKLYKPDDQQLRSPNKHLKPHPPLPCQQTHSISTKVRCLLNWGLRVIISCSICCLEIIREIRKKNPNMQLSSIEEMAEYEVMNRGHKSRAFYRLAYYRPNNPLLNSNKPCACSLRCQGAWLKGMLMSS